MSRQCQCLRAKGECDYTRLDEKLSKVGRPKDARDMSAAPVKHGHYLDYGVNRLRLVSPVLVGARIRGKFKIKDLIVDEKGRNIDL